MNDNPNEMSPNDILASKEYRKYVNKKRTVPADNFMGTIAANVDNEKLSDADFRELIRNTLPIVIYTGADKSEEEKES